MNHKYHTGKNSCRTGLSVTNWRHTCECKNFGWDELFGMCRKGNSKVISPWSIDSSLSQETSHFGWVSADFVVLFEVGTWRHLAATSWELKNLIKLSNLKFKLYFFYSFSYRVIITVSINWICNINFIWVHEKLVQFWSRQKDQQFFVQKEEI